MRHEVKDGGGFDASRAASAPFAQSFRTARDDNMMRDAPRILLITYRHINLLAFTATETGQ